MKVGQVSTDSWLAVSQIPTHKEGVNGPSEACESIGPVRASQTYLQE